MPTSSPVPPPLISAPRITTLFVSLIVASSAGTKYVYSAYAPQLGARLNISHTQLNILAITATVGSSLSSPVFGKIVDSRGPRILLICAFIFLISGYSGIRLLYNSGLPPDVKSLPTLIFAALMLCSSLVGSGGIAAYNASVNSTAKTFPERARGSTTGLVISGYGLSPFIFSGIAHLFFAGNTSAFLLLLALGTSLPMILGAFLIRPIPLPVQDSSDLEEGQGHLEGISSALEPYNSSHTPLLDYDFAEGIHSSNVHRTGHFDESYTLDDVPSHREDGDVIARSSRGARMLDQKPNIHGRKLWLSGDFWLLFTIFAILSGTGLTYINNVGTISQILYAHENSEYDEVKASGWQAGHVSLISLMSFSGRMSIGFISDFVRNTYDLPRSYLLVLIASLFFVSQLMLANVTDISHLWIPSSLLGLAHGTLYSIYPTVCLEWFGMPHFSENWGYLGLSLLAGGNLFSLAFGRNLDAHDISPKHSNPPTHGPVCVQGLDCYVQAIYLTIGATFLSILLCVWAGYREKQKNSMRHISRT
ncbi:MFS general substrate transporter [Phlegmacium glaucopus]|nr:MFS general substrate transporter [Phlegmacium glaucopus]